MTETVTLTWYAAPTKFAKICGSCNAGLIQNAAGTVQFARTRNGLIRCRRCAEGVQGWCLWPKGQRYAQAEIEPPAPAQPVQRGIPAVSQPWVRMEVKAVEFKRRQAGNGEE
jgi:hypothetical protein